MVKSGDVVRVKVLDVDMPRKRISLTLRLDDEATPGGRTERPAGKPAGQPAGGGRPAKPGGQRGGGQQQRGGGQQQRGGGQQQRGGGRDDANFGGGALADALRRAGLDKGLDGLPQRKPNG